MTKTVGIMGGVGPLATADFFRKMILMTRAEKDQEHLHIIVDNDASVPDRTEALLRGGEDPTPYFIRSARLLESAGAGILAMPCCTGHAFLTEIQAAIDTPILNMLTETARYISRQGVSKAALLATDGMLSTGLFDRAFEAEGVELIKPDDAGQRAVMGLIYDAVKRGDWDYDTSVFRRSAENLLAQGARALVLGCTELPVAFEKLDIDMPYADPTAILAASAIIAAGAQVAPGQVTQLSL